MLSQYLKQRNQHKTEQNSAENNGKRGRRGMKLKGIIALMLIFSLILPSAAFAEAADPPYIGFTSDVHGNTGNLTT